MSDLISRSELTESIKRQYCTGCDNYNGSRCRACHADDMLSLVDDTADAMPRWISVKERLPEERLCVSVYIQEDGGAYWIETAFRRDGKWSIQGEYVIDRNITHWMPLPEPPKEPEA